jgi:hypothetical protein
VWSRGFVASAVLRLQHLVLLDEDRADVREYAAKQKEIEAGMAEKSAEFREKDGEVYVGEARGRRQIERGAGGGILDDSPPMVNHSSTSRPPRTPHATRIANLGLLRKIADPLQPRDGCKEDAEAEYRLAPGPCSAGSLTLLTSRRILGSSAEKCVVFPVRCRSSPRRFACAAATHFRLPL